MTVPPEQLAMVQRWVEKAEMDYLVVQQLLKMGDDCPVDAVCFHAQQCVEKFLKARLVYLNIDFPKIHDIGDIISLMPPGFIVPLTLAEQERLTSYAWMGRYPGDWGPVTRQQAEESAALAIKVRAAVRAAFPNGVIR